MRAKTILGAVTAAAVLFGAHAAGAAGPYTISAGGAYGSTVTGTAFSASGCTATVRDSDLNGYDARILDINWKKGKTANISWSSTVPGGVGSLTANFYTSACAPIGTTIAGPTAPGTWLLAVPGNAKWLVVGSNAKANVTFTVT